MVISGGSKGSSVSVENTTVDHEDTTIKVYYHDREDYKIPRLEIFENGDFIDLRAAKDIELKMGKFTYVPLGVSIKLPKGYWGQVVPRSSSYKNYGFIVTNSFGVIDESYCGQDDQWHLPILSLMKDGTKIAKGDRICQFRIVKKIPFNIEEVSELTDENRGGLGSTGKREIKGV